MKSSRLLSSKALGALAALLLVPAAAAAEARFSSVSVEAQPANLLARRSLEPQLRAAFADQTAPRAGQRLVVRITTVMFTPNPSGGVSRSGGFGGGDDNRDYLEGIAYIVAPGGRVISEMPLLVSQDAAGSGWHLPDNEARRMDSLSLRYAQWLRRKLSP